MRCRAACRWPAIAGRRANSQPGRDFRFTLRKLARTSSGHAQSDLIVSNIIGDGVNRTGFVGGLIPREDQAHGPTKQVLPRAA